MKSPKFALILVHLVLLFLATNLFSQQSSWFWQNPLPQGNNLTSVKFVNSNTAFAVGYSGTVMKSTDAGNSWSYQTTGTNNHYMSVYFTDANTGHAAGYYLDSGTPKGVVSKTTDGGIIWATINLPTYSTLNSIYFTDYINGFAVDGAGHIIKTTNSGVNWSTQFTSSNGTLYSIQFVNSNIGYACGAAGTMLKTANSGMNWNYQQTGITYDIYSLCFVDSINGYAAPFQSPLKTTNGGINWFILNSVALQIPKSVFFLNENTGFVIGSALIGFLIHSDIFRTTNGGYNWNWIVSDSGHTLNGISSFNGNNLLSVGDGITIFKSSDGGNSWRSLLQGQIEELRTVFFLDANTGFAGGWNSFGNWLGVILKTTNGGLNWINNYTTASQNFWKIYFRDAMTDYAAGGLYASNGIFLKTTNGGSNWSQPFIYIPAVTDFMFPDANTGYFVTAYLGILKTTTSGGNWFTLISWAYQRLNSIFCLNNSLVYVTGDSGFVVKTTNGGTNWNNLQTGLLNNLHSVYFLNNYTGFISGTAGLILKTTNEGQNWSSIHSVTTQSLGKISFIDNNTGYICGTFGTILKTTNAGLNWFSQPCVTSNDLFSSYFINSNTGFIVGKYGTIIKTTSGGEPIGINPISNNIPKEFYLYQNYPNPFNPVTKIKFDIATVGTVPRTVRLTIYDILGREIATIVNEQLKIGTYEIEWDGSNYASGIYFYRLTAGDASTPLSITKKMVLIK